jgi:NADH-ubiquinone oxidoreductase chain 2
MILLFSSLLSLVIGTVLGLNQSRIKRLYAYSTISHLGFMLLALGINSVESIQAFVFYIMQYSITNLNAFIILIAVGYSLYIYTYKNKEDELNIIDVNNSPIQYVSQLKGFFEINPILAISLSITIYSFVGIPPLVGFFAKQMVLSSALSKGYIFITFIAILTSVISAVYYLGIIKQLFFDKCDYEISTYFDKALYARLEENKKRFNFTFNNVILSSSLTIIISILTLLILLFMLNPQE